jgi:DNA polymerase V
MPYFLIDCNQFYVSCEQLFNPKLLGKAVVVLSNNDGCVVARSKQAKALGIPMGAPAFQYSDLFKEKGVHVFSSNYALYGDISERVMQTLRHFSPQLEEYSIDEAFLFIETSDLFAVSSTMKNTVKQWTGIPVSIGVGKTKTLAKVANDLAKNKPQGIFSFSTEEEVNDALKDLPVEEIWGIGSRLGKTLDSYGICTALELINAPDEFIKKHFSVTLLRTVWELRGIECLSLEETAPAKQSITCSRSFGKPILSLDELSEALSSYTVRAAEKLRCQDSVCSFLSVFLLTSAFGAAPYAKTLTISLPEPSSYSPLLISYAKAALKKIYKEGLFYKKTGIVLGGILPKDSFQRDLFHSNEAIEKQQKTMDILDQINSQLGKKAVRFAAEGTSQKWRMRRDKCTRRFTTKWNELLTIKI